MAKRLRLTSFENTSLLRKLTIFYFIMSIVPMSVLFYLFSQVKSTGNIELSVDDFELTLIFVVLGVLIGYFAMRQMIMRIIDIAKENRIAIEEILGPKKARTITVDNKNEIAILAQSFNEITSRLEQNVRNLELAKKTLHSVLSKVGEGITTMENIDNFLNLIVETVTQALQAEKGVLLLKDKEGRDLTVKAVFGKDLLDTKQVKISLDHEIFGFIVKERLPSVIERVPHESALLSIFQAPMLVSPLLLHDDILGVIAVSGRKSEEPFDDEEKNLLYNLALQTAVAIENSKLNEDAEKTYFETISALALAVEAKDPYSRGHLDRVAKFVVHIAKGMNLSKEDVKTLRDAARLHDIGKIGVTDKILKKNGPLNATEMDMMRKHCEIGEGIIKPIRSLRNLCDVIRHHHEKLDGSGYPDGLKGEQVHLLARILAVADIYDALTTDRPYRTSFSRGKAIDLMRSMKDQLDQRLVDILSKSSGE
ncbi:MAG: HD domain-containing protein [Candidatus Omnitrophica bacterium]|nr:HD domain-containing protein [Candidatus Omnitrophota bacterium]